MFTGIMPSFLAEVRGDSMKQSAMWSRKIGDLVKKEVMSVAVLCILLHTLYGAMTAFTSIFQPYTQSCFLLFEEGVNFLQKELTLSVP
jgi:hypothetical protein